MNQMPMDAAPTKSVTITANADGTFSVESEAVESEAAESEAEEGPGMEDQSEGSQQAATIDDALNLARQMLQAEGKNMRADIAQQVWPAQPQQPQKGMM